MSKKFVIVRGLVGLLDPLTIDCISYLNKELEWTNGPSLLCKSSCLLFTDANQYRNYFKSD